jgi:hypothetical protein
MAQWYQTINATKRFRLGTTKKSIDGSIFLYGKGVASNAVGAWCSFQDNTFTPVLTTGVITGFVGISCSANTSATNFSWYMIYGATQNNALAGLVSLSTDASGDKKPIYQQASAGVGTTATAAATKTIFGAFAVGNPASNLGNAILNYPFTEGTSTL